MTHVDNQPLYHDHEPPPTKMTEVQKDDIVRAALAVVERKHGAYMQLKAALHDAGLYYYRKRAANSDTAFEARIG